MPDRISQPLRLKFGRISISKSENKFAAITSVACAGLHLRTSAK